MVQRRPFDKYFDRGLRLWIVKTARKNYWRVAAWHDLDDLISEGYLAFAIVRARYSDRIQNKRHLMALVKIVYINRITDLANMRTLQDEISISQITPLGIDNYQNTLEILAGGEEADAELQTLLGTASKEIRLFMEAINTPAGQDRLRRPARLRPDGTRETNNERFCRMIGIERMDLEGALKALLKPGSPELDWPDRMINLMFPKAV